MYKVSVIMPIYNNEATLKRAIDSILNQSTFDSELILINDGSTDSSAQICMEYAKREPLIIQVIHQEQSGFAQARNRGLRMARGSYIYFASAQNVVAPRMLETNLRLAEEKNAELVVFGFVEAMTGVEQIPNMPFLLSKKRFRNHYRNFHHFFPYDSCNKLYQAQYLKNHSIQFTNDGPKEDAVFNLAVYKELSKVVFNRQVFCQKGKTEDYKSLRSRHQNWEKHLQLITYLEQMLATWELQEEYEDVILREYYELLKNEVSRLASPDLALSNAALVNEVESLLMDERMAYVFNTEKNLSTKSPYERILWSHFRKRKTHGIINLVTRKRQTTKFTQKLKSTLNKWFTN